MDKVNQVPSHSPVPEKKEAPKETPVDFPEAIRAVIEGHRITKLEWGNKNIYGFLKDSWLMLHRGDGTDHQWLVNDGDLFGQDWIIIRVN